MKAQPTKLPPHDWFRRHRLKLRHLTVMLAVERTQNVGRAAEELHTSQPAVSRAIQEIEQAVGTALFERRSNGTFATPAGAALLRHAREIFGSLERAGLEIDALASGAGGALAIGCNFSSAAFLVPQAVLKLKEQVPGLAVSIRESSLEVLLPTLRSRECDVVVARPLRGHREPDLVEEVLVEEPMCIICAPDHPLARTKRLRWADLRPWPWVMPPRGTPVREGLEELFRQERFTPADTGIECVSILATGQLLGGLNAIAVTPFAVARHYVGYGLFEILPLKLPLVFGPIATITLAGRDPTPALGQFIECLATLSAKTLRAPK